MQRHVGGRPHTSVLTHSDKARISVRILFDSPYTGITFVEDRQRLTVKAHAIWVGVAADGRYVD